MTVRELIQELVKGDLDLMVQRQTENGPVPITMLCTDGEWSENMHAVIESCVLI